MPKLVAVTEVRYAAVNLFPGDEFEASETDAVLLKAIGKAADAPAKPAVAAAQTARPPRATKAMSAESGEKKPVEPMMFQGTPEAQPAATREYSRRDMKAED